ncbi:ras and EF-hand domain-containing protein-like isoform X6 [Actinia tenebrosa]|uniref:Ras and EF-hand domain-containing protein-like isoform X6 n=1 Tax=Actinia tenebrosa TaxID=6105 RepID=A0A6P8I9Q8_ACTTE|nr:ras and EF-hand domain-containing protein-like isoform X6 [Actinia tenebrosa]
MDDARGAQSVLVVKDIFQSWDTNKSGFIEKRELEKCCEDLKLSTSELERVFIELDVDRDGRISLSDFYQSFEKVCKLFHVSRDTVLYQEVSEKMKFEQLLEAIGFQEHLTGHEYVTELFHHIHSAGDSPQLLSLLESFLFSVVRDIKNYESENQRLEEALKRTCEKHAEHMENLDEELEQQLSKVEHRIKKEEKSKYERSNMDVIWQMENKNKEIQALQAKVQKLESKIKRKEPEEQKLKEEIDERVQEIRYLRSQVTDAQTNTAVLRSELAQLRNDYEDQTVHLENEKRTVMECVQEQESLTRQLQLLHEANKKLHDTNDDLRSALEARRTSETGRSPSPSKRSSITTLYSPGPKSYKRSKSSINSRSPSSMNDADDRLSASLGATPLRSPLHSCASSRRNSLLPVQQSCEEDDPALNEDSLMNEIRGVNRHRSDSESETNSEVSSVIELDYNNNAGILNNKETGRIHHLVPPARQSCEVEETENQDPAMIVDPVLERYTKTSLPDGTEEEDEAYGTLPSSERESMRMQLNLLAETNKRLCESNNDLRAALETVSKRVSKPRSREKCKRNQSFHSDYGSISSRSITPNHLQGPKSENDIADGAEDLSGYEPESDGNNTSTLTTESLADTDLSKVEILSAELEAQFKSVKEEDEEDIDEDDVDDEELAQLVAMATGLSESEEETESELDSTDGIRPATIGTSDLSEASTNTPYSHSMTQDIVPERMFKLVLAGDAAVGKSSFILRLCRNRFHNALNSTLGVDFQMKTLVVEGKTIALQLWDTAGQERFRSIAKSYFRKADGVLLLYDVTCETSFLDVRDWVEAIEESCSKPVPIMLCGNKTDLRQQSITEGKMVISAESGQKLAKEYGALFMETSAKDNQNITEACMKLARMLQDLEDIEVNKNKDRGLQLSEADAKAKKKTSCCPR